MTWRSNYAPPTRSAWLPTGHDRPVGRCKSSCCKTPYGHSAEAPSSCACHVPAESTNVVDLSDYFADIDDDSIEEAA